jgi:hypothetical protein
MKRIGDIGYRLLRTDTVGGWQAIRFAPRKFNVRITSLD